MGIEHLFRRQSVRRPKAGRDRSAAFRPSRFEPLEGRALLAAYSYAGGTYQQSFDGLGTTNSSVTNRDLENLSSSLAGWYFNETGTSANTSITVGTGSGSTGDTYNLGASGTATDRALGGLQSGSTVPSWGFQLTNNTGGAIEALNIAYTGQTWRVGGVNRSDRIDFQYSLDATSLSTGTWTDVNALDYANPGQATTANGSVIHSQAISGTLGSLGLANGASLFIRWTDFNPSGADDAIAVNDFSLSPAAVNAPTVDSPTSAAVTSSGGTLGGTVASDGGATVTERGIVLAVKADNAAPQIGGAGVTKVAASAGGTGVFTAPVTGLVAGTLYAFKAYATNSVGTTYSDVAEFTTGLSTLAPSVSTPTSTAVFDALATLGGTVESDGGDPVTERGIVYSLQSDNGLPEIGGVGVTKIAAAAAGIGVFTVNATALTPASGYAFRAYATNGVGTTYTDVSAFTTTVAATAPVVDTPAKTAIRSTTASLGGNVTGDGGRPITQRGIVYAPTATNANPVIGGDGVIVVAAADSFTGVFTVPVTGLAALTGYSFKAFATNGVGTSYTAVDTFTTFDTETPLTAGDIAFTGYQLVDTDAYSFVLLKDVVAGTSITFTDNGWAAAQSGFANTNEGVHVVQFSSAFAAGSHFLVTGGSTLTFALVNGGGAAGSVSNQGTGISLSASGDSVLAYQGAAPTSGSATNWIAGVNSRAWAASTFTGTNDSGLPSALVNGTTAIGFTTDVDNGAYNKASFTGTAALIRAEVGNAANWTRSDVLGPVSTTVFTVANVVTATTLLVTPSTVDFGTNVSFDGTVTAATGTDSPTGTVEIRNGGATGTLLAQASVVASGAGASTYSIATTTVPAGTYADVKAYFVPSGVFLDSASGSTSLTVNVVGAVTTTGLTSISPLSSTFGTDVTFEGTVVAATGTATPVGTIEIRNGGPAGTLLASTSTITGTGASGTFSIVSSALPIGSYANVQAFFIPTSQLDFVDSASAVFSGGTLAIAAAPFTPGNLLVLRVGDGATSIINGTPGNVAGAVTLLEYTPAGLLVQAIPVASSGVTAATLRLNSTSEGSLSLSADRQTVTFGGFRTDAGPTNPNTGSSGRVIAKIGPDGSVNTTQAIAGVFADNSFRSVVTDDGTNFWLAGAGTNGGIQYVAGGSATSATTLTSGSDNVRQVQILDGNLFVSSGAAAPGRSVFQVGVGLPTTATAPQTATFTPAASAQYQSYFFADLDASVGWRNTAYDTLYATEASGSIAKFGYVVTGGVGSWNASGTVAFSGASNMTGSVSAGTVTLFVTSGNQDTGTLGTLIDSTGSTGDISTQTVVALATPVASGTNYAFRGVTFVPRSGVSTTTTITALSPATAEQADSVTFTATVVAGSGTSRPTGSVEFRSGTLLLATATLADGGDTTTGTATVTVSMTAIPVGTYTVTAQYVPDGNPSLNVFNPGTSAAFGTPLVIQAVGVVTTTTLSDVSWAAQPSPAAYGDAITFSGRVATADTSTPVGTVEIRSGGSTGTLLGSTSTFAADGSFTITTSSPIPSGIYASVAAHFVGATGFKSGSSADSSTVLEISSTTLLAGDIAFTGFQVTGTDERISFVLLADVIAGTTLTITDNAWNGTALTTAEGTSTITFTQAFAAGTQVDYDATRATGSKWQTGGSAAGIFDSTPTALALGNSGDNVFAYQGTAPTSGSAAGWIAAFSSQAFLETGSASATVTYLPSSLILGDTAFSTNLAPTAASQNAWLNDLGTVTNTASAIRTTVSTVANWTAGLDSTTSTPIVPSPTIFILGSAATPAIGTTGSPSALSTLLGTASVATTVAVTGTNLAADIVATAPAGFEVSSDGSTFGSTATFTRSGTSVSGMLSVRLAAATAVGTYAGDVSLASTGATGVTVAIPTSTVTDELVFDVADGQTVTDTTARSGAIKIIKRGLGTLVLNLANSHTGVTTVAAGTLRLSAADALASSAVSVGTGGTLLIDPGLTMRSPLLTLAGGTLAASGVTLLVNATTGIATFAITSGTVTGSPGLTVSGNGVVTLPTDRRQILDLSTLSIDQATDGRIDIGKGRINVAVDGTTEAALRADVIAGRNAGAFNGTSGIMTTGGRASLTSTNPAVGYRILPNRTAIVAWAAYGDTNLDGQVNNSDITNILNGQKYGKGIATGATWAQGDFNYSGGVTQTDITLYNSTQLANKGSYLPVAPSSTSGGLTTPVVGSLSADVWAAYAVSVDTQQQTKKR